MSSNFEGQIEDLFSFLITKQGEMYSLPIQYQKYSHETCFPVLKEKLPKDFQNLLLGRDVREDIIRLCEEDCVFYNVVTMIQTTCLSEIFLPQNLRNIQYQKLLKMKNSLEQMKLLVDTIQDGHILPVYDENKEPVNEKNLFPYLEKKYQKALF